MVFYSILIVVELKYRGPAFNHLSVLGRIEAAAAVRSDSDGLEPIELEANVAQRQGVSKIAVKDDSDDDEVEGVIEEEEDEHVTVTALTHDDVVVR